MDKKIALVLALMLIGGVAFFANTLSVNAADPSYSLMCRDQNSGSLANFLKAPMCDKPGSCTPGQTFCEDRSIGARMTTCTASGVWGSWKGCGRYNSCDVGGLGGKC
ncbi:hypothetical protein AUJ84_02685 [Candidatus Pacearchaeota archaeon CG1_02_32_132]|nr:MAG: hypothetical protein AUJ84_02685 [Candidatus Pacearchaeota archaeon CG1_02_32_132]